MFSRSLLKRIDQMNSLALLSRPRSIFAMSMSPGNDDHPKTAIKRSKSRSSIPWGSSQADHSRGLSNSTATASAFALAEAYPSAPEQTTAYEFAMSLNILNRHRALVLDSAYRPIEIVNWQRAICMLIANKADVLEFYEQTVNSVREEFFLPAVMRARRYNGRSGKVNRVSLNRRNIMLRDNFECQYCGKEKNTALTIDHIVAQSRGGQNSWENLVTACAQCNAKKGSKTLKELKWKLRKVPKEPSPYELNVVLAAAAGNRYRTDLPPEWENYLYKTQK